MATTTFERADGVTADVTVRFSSSIFYRWTTTPTSATVGPSIDITDDAQAAYLKTVNLLKVTGETGVYVPPAKPKRVFWDDTNLIGVDDAGGNAATIPVVKGADLGANQIPKGDGSGGFTAVTQGAAGGPADHTSTQSALAGKLTVLPSPGASTDCSAALQAALDSSRAVHLVPGATYLINASVFLDATDNNSKYVIYAHGATIKIGTGCAKPSGWVASIAAAPPTAFFSGTLRSAESAGVVTTTAANGAASAPTGARLVIYDAIIESNSSLGAEAACVVFGGAGSNGTNGTANGLVNCILKKIIAGISWVGYADGNFAEGCEIGQNPAGNNTRIIYQRDAGDNTRIVRCKGYGGFVADLSGAYGFVIEQFIAGQVNVQTSHGRISVAHTETDEANDAVPWSINIDRARVTIAEHYSWNSNTLTKPSIRINDAASSPQYVASEVTIRDWRPVARFSSTSGDNTKGWPLYITALNTGGRVRVQNTRGVVLVSGSWVGWLAPRVGSADSAITAAIAAASDTIATGSWELLYDTAWRVVPVGGMPPSRQLAAPTLAVANHATATGSLTNGQVYEYVAAIKTQGGAYSALSSAVQATANSRRAVDLTVTNPIPPCTIVVWRKAGAGVASAPDAYVEIGLDAPVTQWLDMGANINGRAWITTSVPVPNTVRSTGCQATFPRAAYKTANEVVNNSATLQDDNELVFPLEASAIYEFSLYASYDASTAADVKFAFAVPSGATLSVGQMGPFTAATGNSGSVTYASGTTSGAPPANAGGAGVGTRIAYTARGTVKTSTTAGNLQLQWAQANADASDTTVYAGSVLRVERIG